ncbi:MAG: MFS transporter [Acidobacteria bacterium]|nr:MFS transporter [Acidobacteriota bacterium]
MSVFYRWTVLAVLSLAMFGNYYVYDSISPLADLLSRQLGFSDAEIGWLYAIYSIPNIFVVLLSGILIDRFGSRMAAFVFALLCSSGAVVTALTGSLSVMAFGRLLFGLGAESMIVATNTVLAKWFRGKELSLAFGLNLTVARLGSFAALNSPSWARSAYQDWQTPLVLAAGMGLLCISGASFYWLLESRTAAARVNVPIPKGIVFQDTLNFGRSYWYIVGLCVTFYSAIFPFQTFAVKFFMDAHGTSRELGGFLSSMLTLFAMIFTPLFGYVSDRVGKRSHMMMAGSLALTPVYLLMAHTDFSLYVPVAVLGLAFSLIPAVMWPAVAYVVEDFRLGTAYGLMTMIQNMGLAAFNLLVGWTNDHSGAGPSHPAGYAPGMWIFAVLGLLGFVFAMLLKQAEQGPAGHGLDTITTDVSSNK